MNSFLVGLTVSYYKLFKSRDVKIQYRVYVISMRVNTDFKCSEKSDWNIVKKHFPEYLED